MKTLFKLLLPALVCVLLPIGMAFASYTTYSYYFSGTGRTVKSVPGISQGPQSWTASQYQYVVGGYNINRLGYTSWGVTKLCSTTGLTLLYSGGPLV